MEVIFFLIIIGVMVAIGFLIAFFWAVKSGQFDDSFTPAVRMLFDDGTIIKPKALDNQENKQKQ